MTNSSILFVDDDHLLARAFSRDMRRFGLAIDVASHAQEAMVAVQRHAYPVVVTDYILGETTGLALVEQMRAVLPHAIFVLATGSLDAELAAMAVNKYAVRFLLQKPWRSEEAASVLHQAMQLADGNTVVGDPTALRSDMQTIERLLCVMQDQLVEVLVDALGRKVPNLEKHGRRLAGIADTLAVQIGMAAPGRMAVLSSALWHDVSTIAIPDRILLKPGPLDPDERLLMVSHVEVGRRLLDRLGGKEEACQVFAEHHERWDGEGYPNKLAGARICLGARLFAVADAFDAIISGRPYRRAASIEAAVNELRRCAGSQFDPGVVQALIAIPRDRLAVAIA
jgi:response regulator RpfG family c-di-GMP phosphodiesterase